MPSIIEQVFLFMDFFLRIFFLQFSFSDFGKSLRHSPL